VRFENEGDNPGDGRIPADIVFIIKQKPHGNFRRDGNDLVLKQSVPLWSALTGFTSKIQTLDGRELRVSCPEGARPGATKVVPGEGMPLSKNPSSRGNLRIEFSINFPPTSAFAEDEQRKANLRAALSGL
jgi:DnaJ family protein B protein 4